MDAPRGPVHVDQATEQKQSGPRTRRSVLAAAAAAAGAIATQAVLRPGPASAAGNVVLGEVNTAISPTTIRTTEAVSTAVALKGVVLTTGTGGGTAGVLGQSYAQNGGGVLGLGGPGAGSKGVIGRSAAGSGVYGVATGSSGLNYGVYGTTRSSGGVGVAGAGGVYGVAGSGVTGLYGKGTVYGVYGGGTTSGVYGYGDTGVVGFGNKWGVHGEINAISGRGVVGLATAVTGSAVGMYGASLSPSGTGVIGYAPATTGSGYGIEGQSDSPAGVGVAGTASAATGTTRGVLGTTNSPAGAGVLGLGIHGQSRGVEGQNSSLTGIGVLGAATWTGGANFGVYGGSNSGLGTGVYGIGGRYGIYGKVLTVGTGYAGYFKGSVYVEGDIAKLGGHFLIDHPQDPANMTLRHSFVEAPERLNIYSGTARLDGKGSAIVRLPGYFAALNGSYRYQLTPIGAPAPTLYVAEEVENGRFRIAGGDPGLKVCWIVTGVRQDAWAKAQPVRVEQRKRLKDRGRYLSPEAFGKPESAGMHYLPEVKIRPERRRQDRAPTA
jgi:hypothetical protein